MEVDSQAGTAARFVIVGVTTAILYFILFYGMRSLLGWLPLLASAIAYLAGFVFAYLCHNYWTFRSQVSVRHSLPRYSLLQIVCLCLTAGLTQALYFAFEFEEWIVSAISTALAAGMSYVVSTLWVFVGEKSESGH